VTPVCGHKRLVVAGSWALCLLTIVLQWVESYPAFHVLLFFTGVSLGVYLPAILPIITETYESRQWGRVIGIHDSAASFSIFVVPLFITYGLHFLPWKRLILLFGAAALLLPFLFWKISIEPRQIRKTDQVGYRQLLRNRNLWILGFLWVCSASCCMGLYSILPLYLVKERGIAFDAANTMLGLSRAAGILVTISAGFLADRFGYQKVIRWCLLSTGLSTVAFSLVTGMPMILILLVFQAVVSVVYFPIGLAAVSDLFSVTERSMATGLVVSFGVVFGMGGTPFILGVIADHLNFQVGILGIGVLASLATLSVGFIKRTAQRGGGG
jgi:MFS family permease